MPATEQDLFDCLDALGIAHATHRHPPVFTVDESQSLRGVLPGGHCKSLFLKDKKGVFVLAVVDEARRVDLKALSRSDAVPAGRLSFASEDHVVDKLGVRPGSVTPFALVNETARDVAVVLDAAMMENDPLNYHPLHNEATTAIAPSDLLRFLRHCGVEPVILDLDAL